MSIDLSKRRLIFITGKGGVGKTTLAHALGRIAAKRGLKTIVVELAGEDGFAAPSDGAKRLDRETELEQNLFTITIDSQTVMEEYLRLKLPSPLATWLARSRLFGALSWATPGLRELLAIGKVWELSQVERTVAEGQRFDLVIVDAPASGHGVGVLRAPRTFATIAKIGPVAHTGELIDATLHDREFTSIIAVTNPEEIPISETLELEQALRDDELTLDTIVVNAMLPQRFDADDDERLAAAVAGAPLSAAIACARTEHHRATEQARQRARLGPKLLERSIELPLVVKLDGGRSVVDAISTVLAEWCV